MKNSLHKSTLWTIGNRLEKVIQKLLFFREIPYKFYRIPCICPKLEIWFT